MSCREKGMMTCELYGWQHLLAASHFMYMAVYLHLRLMHLSISPSPMRARTRYLSLSQLLGSCSKCCKVCCYSTPFGTISALSVTVVGLVGFLSSSIYGVVMVDASEDLRNQ